MNLGLKTEILAKVRYIRLRCEWFNFSDDKTESMDDGALDWCNKYKDFINQAIELTPALKTED